MSDASGQPGGPSPVPPRFPWRSGAGAGQLPPAPWAGGSPAGRLPPGQPPSGTVGPAPAPGEGPTGVQPGWLPGPRRDADRDRSAPGTSPAALLTRPAPELAALAAVLAGGLLCLASLARTLLVPAGDFGLTLGDRIRGGTDVLVVDLPLVLAVALVAGALGTGRSRTADRGALVVGAAGSLLLLLRLLAHLLADDRVFSGGAGERLAASLVDLATLVLTLTLTWWASRRRRDEATAPGPAPPPGTWAQGPSPPGTRS